MHITYKSSLLICALAASGLVTIACGGGSGLNDDAYVVRSGTVISNVTVVDTRDGATQPNMAVVIDQGTIRKVVPTASVRAADGVQRIDATGKYVVPGYVDMHTHAMVRVDAKPSYFPLMIANGVTSFREAGDFPGAFPKMIERSRQLNADIAAGRVSAPEVLLVPGDILNGLTSVATTVELVRQQKTQGADYIKVIGGTREAILAVLAESKAQGLFVAGHVTPDVGPTESAKLGWKLIDHMGVLQDCANDASQVVNTYSEDKCKALATVFVQQSTWQVPTLRRVRGINSSDDAALMADPNLVYVDKTRLALWQETAKAFSARTEAQKTAARQTYELTKKATLLMKRNGVKMMAGSDAGRASTWVIPGFGLQEDFRELAAAGLSGLEILQMATLNPAEFLGRQSTMGTVDEGKKADLVLLDANPVDNPAHLGKIWAVFLKGRHYASTDLDKLKAEVATLYANEPAPLSKPALEPAHVH